MKTPEERLQERIRNLASKIFEPPPTRMEDVYEKGYPKTPEITEVQAHLMACNELMVEFQAKQAAALFNIQIQLTKIANNPSLYEKANDEITDDKYHRERGDQF